MDLAIAIKKIKPQIIIVYYDRYCRLKENGADI